MSEPWCDLCDLPLDTCVHGRPPTPPPATTRSASGSTSSRRTPATRAPRTTTRSSSAARLPSVRRAEVRLTPQSAFRPHILAALQERGGSAGVEELMDDVHERMADVLLDGDHETIGRNELRWRYSSRFERKAMTEDGLMEPARTPGVWELTPEGLRA